MPQRSSPWRWIRIAVLLFTLATVAQSAWLARSRTAEWTSSLRVVIYPINADGSQVSAAYVGQLRYVEPNAQPLYPQQQAEIMAGRIPVSETRAEIPEGMDQVAIGLKTAREIHWVK